MHPDGSGIVLLRSVNSHATFEAMFRAVGSKVSQMDTCHEDGTCTRTPYLRKDEEPALWPSPLGIDDKTRAGPPVYVRMRVIDYLVVLVPSFRRSQDRRSKMR